MGPVSYTHLDVYKRQFLASVIRPANGYSAVWPALDTASADGFQRNQALRQTLLRELTSRGGYLAADGAIRGELLYPPKEDALAAARRYRQVVVTQRYVKGKDVFPETPITFRYLREDGEGFAHQDGRPYRTGDVITDRPIDLENPALITFGAVSYTHLDVYKRQTWEY